MRDHDRKTKLHIRRFGPVPPAPLAMKNDLITSIIILRGKDEIGPKCILGKKICKTTKVRSTFKSMFLNFQRSRTKRAQTRNYFISVPNRGFWPNWKVWKDLLPAPSSRWNLWLKHNWVIICIWWEFRIIPKSKGESFSNLWHSKSLVSSE